MKDVVPDILEELIVGEQLKRAKSDNTPKNLKNEISKSEKIDYFGILDEIMDCCGDSDFDEDAYAN